MDAIMDIRATIQFSFDTRSTPFCDIFGRFAANNILRDPPFLSLLAWMDSVREAGQTSALKYAVLTFTPEYVPV